MTTINIKINSVSEDTSPADLLRELALILSEMKTAELNRPANNIGGEISNISIQVIN